jgi:hypothetical protein
MTSATSTLTTAPPPTQTAAPPGLRLQLDPTMAGTGAVDGGWWPRSRDPDAELPASSRAWTAAGIGGQGPAPMPPRPLP